MKVYEYHTPRGEDRIVVNISGGADHVITLEGALELSARLDTAIESVRQRRQLAKDAAEKSESEG